MTNLLDHLRGLASPPQDCQPRHYYWLDLVRGCAALAILVWHYQHFYYQTAGRNPIVYDRDVQPFYSVLSLLYDDGYFAVQLFWVISGFVFASVYASAQTSGREFFVNRFARLYPLHFATLVAVAALQALSFHLQREFQIYSNNDIYHFVLNLLFISHWGFQAGDSFNGPIWSVSVEVFIYIVFWMSLRYMFRLGIVGPIAMVLLFGALFVLQVPGRLFWECGLFFYLGATTFVWLMHFKDRAALNILIGLVGTIVSSTLLLLEIENAGDISRTILFSSLVLVAASIDLRDLKQRGRRFTLLGDLTYSIYLLHVPVQISLILLMDQFGVDRRIVATHWFFLSFMVLMLAVSMLSYRHFELPMRKWVRQRFNRRAADVSWQGAQLSKD